MSQSILRTDKIFKVLVTYDPPELVIHDAIVFEGALWCVSQWLENLDQGYRIPERLVRPRQSQYDLPGGSQDLGLLQVDYVLSGTLPKAVVEGRARPEEAIGFLVKEAPDVRFPILSIH
jgi:hypothetical protein